MACAFSYSHKKEEKNYNLKYYIKYPLQILILAVTIYLIYIVENANKFTEESQLGLLTRLQLKDRDVNITSQPVSSYWAI